MRPETNALRSAATADLGYGVASAEFAGLRCLWVGRYIPYPLDEGAKVYSAKLAEALAATGVAVRFMGIGVISVIPQGSAHVDWVPVEKGKRHKIVALFNVLPNAASVDATEAYVALLEHQLREHWHVIVFDGYGAGWALKRCLEYRKLHAFGRTLLVHVSHNHEEKLWRSMAREVRGSLARKLALWQNYCKVRALERSMVRSVDLITTITDEDRRSLTAGVGDANTLTLTPGYAGWIAGERRINPDTPRRVILMGSFRWVVKQENLARFIELADPAFSANAIGLDVVGDVPDALLGAFQAHCRATRFHGFVANVAPLFASARIAVVPEALGGGFKLKFLDYFFGRVPVATLTQAAAGLPDVLREQTLVRKNLSELIDAVVTHIDRIDELNRMQVSAFMHSEAEFAWEDRGLKLKRAIVRKYYG